MKVSPLLPVLVVVFASCSSAGDPDDNPPAGATVDSAACLHPNTTVAALVPPAGGIPPAADTKVTVRGVVATSAKFLVRSIPGNGCVYGFWASDGATAQPSTAILVTGRGNDAPNATTPCPVTGGGGHIPDDLAAGDLVDISAEYIGYRAPTTRCSRAVPQLEDLCAVDRRARGVAVTALANLDVGDLGDDAADPSPDEAVLVTTQPATVTDPDPSHDGSAFTVMGAHGALRVSTLLLARGPAWHGPAAAARFTSLTGIVYFDNCHWQLVPRAPADLVAGP